MYCKNCGKKVETGMAFCTHCGTKQNDYSENSSVVKKAPYNTLCIIGVVVSGISLLLNFAGLVGIAATILSVLGLVSCKKRNENGRAMAIVGIIIGSYSILYGVAQIIRL